MRMGNPNILFTKKLKQLLNTKTIKFLNFN